MKRSSLVLILLALCGVGVGAWYLFWPRLSLPADPLAAVPGDAIGFVRIRVDRVLASDAYKRLIVERGQARGIERVQVLCGFNPLERIEQMVVFARPAPEGGLPRFAFAARGKLAHEELLDCVKKFTHGDVSALTLDEVEGIPVIQSKKGSSRAAFIGRDGVLGGDAEGVTAAIHALRQKAPSAAQDPLLSGLYREIDRGSDVALVSRVPDQARAALQAVARELGPELAQLELVQALALNATASAGRLAGGIELVARNAAEAASLVALGRRAIDRALALPGIGLTPASGVLRAVQMEARADRATFAGSVKVSTVEALLELLPALEQLAGSLDATRPSADAARPSADDAGVAPAREERSAGERPDEKRDRRTRRERAPKSTEQAPSID